MRNEDWINEKNGAQLSDAILDMELRLFDYSVFSKAKGRLLDELLQMHRKKNAGNPTNLLQRLRFMGRRMTDEELDYATAAGNPTEMQAPVRMITEERKPN